MRKATIVVTVALLALAASAGALAASTSPLEWVRSRVVDEATRILGREVQVDAIAGDPVRGVVLSGVRIAGRAGSPGRPVFSAPRITIYFDADRLLRDLAIRRGIAASITAVVLERPLLAVGRDAAGRWNVEDLLIREGETAAPLAFRGEVEIHEGSVTFSDALRLPQRPGSRGSAPFSAHFDRITGTIDFGRAPSIAVALDAVNTDGRTPATARITGRATMGAGTLDLDLTARGAAVDHWGPYIVRMPRLVWGGGTFDATLRLLASPWAGAVALDYRGALRMRDGRALVLPSRTLLSDVEGTLAVDNLGVTTNALTLAVDGSPLWVRGTVGHQAGVDLDLVVRSAGLNLRTLQALLFPRARLQMTGLAGGEARIVGPFESPRLEGRIVRASGSINRQPFQKASGRFSYYGGVLIFDDVNATAAGGRLQGHLRMDLGTRRFFMLAGAQSIEVGALASAVGRVDPTLRGRASGVVTAGGTGDAIVAQSRLVVGAGRAFGLSFDRLDALVGYDRGRVELDRLETRSGNSRLHAFGTGGIRTPLDITVSGADIDLGTIADRVGARRWAAGTADVRGRIRGSLRSPVVQGELRARRGTLGPLPFDEARGPFQLTPAGLDTPGLELADGNARIVAAGRIRWSAPSGVDLRVDATTLSAGRLSEIGRLPIRIAGAVWSTLRLTGPLRSPRLAGAVTLVEGRIEGQRVDRADAEFRWTGSQLIVDRLDARTNASTIAARGTVTRAGRLGITFSATDLDLRDVAAISSEAVTARGHVNLSGALSGTLRSPVVTATAHSRDLLLNGQPFSAAEGSVRYQQGRLQLAPMTLRQDGAAFVLSGTVPLRSDTSFDLQITAQEAELATLLRLGRVRLPVTVRGAINGTFTASGTLANPRASIDFTLSRGRLGDHLIPAATVRAELADQAITLQTLQVRPERGELVGAGRINLRGESEVEFGGTGLALDLLRPLLNIRRPLGGTLDATVQLSGTLNDPVVGMSFSATEGAVGAANFDRLVVQAFYRGGQLNIEHGLLQEERHKVRLSGTVPFNPARLRFEESRPMSLRLDLVDSDLSVLGLLTDRVEQASGPLTGEVTITGTVARPVMQGTVAASGGTVKLRGIAPALEQVTGQISLAEDSLRTGGITARMGGGEVSLAGSASLRNFRLDRLALESRAAGVRLEMPQLYVGLVDAGLRLGGTATRPEISGTAAFSRGDLFVTSLSRGTGAENGRPGLNPALNVDLVAGDALWVNVGALHLQIHGAVRAGGTWRQPRLAGEVSADRGTFVAFNHTFNLTEGRATFTEFRGVVPSVDALAETRVTITRPGPTSTSPPVAQPVRVLLHVTGTPGELTLALSSDPPLSREEIVAALARQVGVTRLLAGESLETVLRAELSAALFGSFGRAVARALGLEEFTIEYDAARPLTLRVGRLLIRDLYVTLTTEFDIQRRYIWGLEWRLTPITMFTLSVDNVGALEFLYRLTYRY